MYLVVFNSSSINDSGVLENTRKMLIKSCGQPPSKLRILTAPKTGNSPNSMSGAATPFATALRAATKANYAFNPKFNTYFAPYFCLIDDNAKDWLLLAQLSTNVNMRVYKADTEELSDALLIADILCYELYFREMREDYKNDAPLLLMHILSQYASVAARIRCKFLDFIDEMRPEMVPEDMIEIAGKNSRLSTKYAAYYIGKTIGTVDSAQNHAMLGE